MTQKTIESLHTNTTNFDKMFIHCYDNLSDLKKESNRFEIFQKLLTEEKIHKYSYDTPNSLSECFGKAIAYYHWMNQARLDCEIRKKVGCKDQHYYLLIDNDMLVGPKWSEYFLSASVPIPDLKTVFFMVKYPGGIPSGAREKERRKKCINMFNKSETFELAFAGGGGGSGFWFMTQEMLLKQNWGSEQVLKTYKCFKKHDTTMWETIYKMFGQHRVNYVMGIVPPEEHPLVLHLGPVIGSMCNSLSTDIYKHKKDIFKEKEKELIQDKNCNEIFEMFKDKCANW